MLSDLMQALSTHLEFMWLRMNQTEQESEGLRAEGQATPSVP